MTSELPIEAIRGPLVEGLATTPNFVIQAEPGAGKTTRVPPMLLEAGVASDGEIWVSQPRRLAARMAAARVAEQLGEPLGETCGYQVRFESKFGPRTRIRFLTEGVLARRLRDQPTLPGVAAVVIDEFHERNIDADVSLALLRRLQLQSRPELRIGVMSATLDPGPIASFLDCAPLQCPGRTFPVDIVYADRSSDRPLRVQISQALHTLALDQTPAGERGSVLVFLPGVAEIRQCLEACSAQARHLGLDPVPLHGELSAAEQDAAVSPRSGPKFIATTNVAETSITVDGVLAVIDSGLARKPDFDPWTGVPRLSLAKISQASAVQRAGRAGRTRPGRCIRLYSRPDFERRPAFDPPELSRADLAQAMLDLRAAGIHDPLAMPWFEPPPTAGVESAEALLRLLGAIDEDGAPTDLGHAMLRLPAHPRLARVMIEASKRGLARTGASVAALLSERPIRRRTAHRAPALERAGITADVLVDLADLETFERDKGSARRLELDAGACHNVLRARRQLLRSLGEEVRDRTRDVDTGLGYALLAGFGDRVAAVRDGGRRVVFGSGGSAELPEDSAAAGSDWVVVLDVEERRGGSHARTVVRSAAAIEADWLLDLFVEHIEERRSVRFDDVKKRVEASEELVFGNLVLERRSLDASVPEASALLFEAATKQGLATFVGPPGRLEELYARTDFAHRHDPEIPRIDEASALDVLRVACQGRSTFAELASFDFAGALLGNLDPGRRAALERFAPREVSLPSGRRLLVHYERDRPPWVQSRLQDFFGSLDGPRIAEGREALVLHLLAPNQRAVQVTTDLAGFWDRHYPDLRKALMRRYPKHAWPEDPRTASPPAPGGGRGQRRR